MKVSGFLRFWGVCVWGGGVGGGFGILRSPAFGIGL